ncbi:MAG: hypothetical protein QOE53_2602 [Pseudonocardiales bacterium]|jgi:hypothetical protein|nr:hypothetical protein [Pseudonocardiales bacterium]
MPSSYLLKRIPTSPARIATDLEQVEPFGFVESYGEFVCGSWRTCVLWNATGDSRDAEIRDYSGTAQMTEAGRKLPYLEELMAGNFELDKLRFARLTRLSPGSVTLPHRDYVELESDLVRIHLPLMTSPEAYACEAATVYRMSPGELWFLDARKVHSVANFSQHSRIHLLLDFAAPDPMSVFLQKPDGPLRMPADSIVERRPLRPGERKEFQALARVVDPVNLMDVLAVLIKRCFVAEMDAVDIYDWMDDIAVESGDPQVLSRARWLRSHCLVSR